VSQPPRQLVIDARPRGPSGPLAGERVQGRTILDHLLDLADEVDREHLPVLIHTRADEHPQVLAWSAGRPSNRFVVALGPPPEGAVILRTDRLYDPARLRRAIRRGKDPESAVIWRLDRPHALAGADDELTRRQSYQPLGRFWALEPSRRIARALAPTRVRPNALTLASAFLVLGASVTVALSRPSWVVNVVAASALALGLVLDTADGHLARLQGTSSAFGRWLDSWLDEVCDMALHAAIAWSAFVQTSQPYWLLVSIVYASGKFLFFVGAAEHGAAPPPSSARSTPVVPARRPSRLQALARFAGHADLRWHLWIVLASMGRLELALVAYAAYYPARSVAMAARKAVQRG
jgi:phosphatidylglycerophosphate synthase